MRLKILAFSSFYKKTLDKYIYYIVINKTHRKSLENKGDNIHTITQLKKGY